MGDCYHSGERFYVGTLNGNEIVGCSECGAMFTKIPESSSPAKPDEPFDGILLRPTEET